MAPSVPLRKRTRALVPSSRSPPTPPASEVMCEECGAGDADEVLLLCDNCDRGFHTFCLRPILACVPKGPWFCLSCSKPKKPRRTLSPFPFYFLCFSLCARLMDDWFVLYIVDFPLLQTKIVDFFRIQRSSLDSDEALYQKQRRKRVGGLVMAKKKRKLQPFISSEDRNRRLEQMASLATALMTTGTVFSDELTYMSGMAPRSANRAALEREGMQVLSKEDAETLNLCKSMMKMGKCPPLMVFIEVLDANRFTVEADKSIKDLTIVAEYVGDVDYLEKREHDDGDSMMTLLSANDPSKSLVICPDKRGNIARFINGINNHTPGGRKKQNLKCVRFDVDGECRVLLIAIRDISKGERLYYDYNGYEQEYPTEHFV
ncbi:hypothetical protein Taro_049370 [Colocasia esculenta]|uniref:[histone H3]-lysine(27) N-methyltransferase n=1 Tax=Colocasia esculenta TaxID=4460 RepID=A0A843XAK9_COLES|nr:hypothetical protein [Colocasia esculenta]